jgi:hypothetical protein
MRRLNRGLFQVAMSQVALEDQEVVPTEVTPPVTDTTTTTDAVVPVTEVPVVTDTPAEVVAAVDNVEVTVKVVTDGAASVEKTESSTTGEVVTDTPIEVTAVTDGTVAVPPVETVSAEDRIKALEAELAMLKEGVKPTTEDNVADVTTTTDEMPVSTDAVVPAAEVPVATDTQATVDSSDTTVVPPTEETKTEASIADGEAATVLVKDDTGTVVATVNTADDTTTVTAGETTVEVTQVGDKVEVEVTVTPEETPAEVPAVAVEDMVIIETDGNEVEIEIQDAVDIAEDTAELTGEIDEAEDAAMALESFAEIAKSAAANGGLDEHGARLLKIATEHIYSHMGLGKAVGIPAMESFRVDGARATATTIAMEDIVGQAKKIWQAVVDGIKKAAEWIQEFVKKILSANARIKARAEKLLAASSKMTGTPKSKMVGDATLVRSLTSGGRISSDLAKEVQKVTTFLDTAIDGRTFTALEKVITVSRDSLFKGGTDKVNGAVMEVIKTISDKSLQFNNVAKSLGAKVGIEEVPSGTTLSMSQRFPGEQVVWAYIPTSAEHASSFRAGIGIDTTTVRIADDAKATVLTPMQISEVAKQVLHYSEVCVKLGNLQGSLKELTSVVNSLITVTAKVDGNETVPETKVLLPVFRVVRQLLKGIHQPAAVVATRVVNASLNLAAASAAQYTAKVA